jgi:hypothetical protein
MPGKTRSAVRLHKINANGQIIESLETQNAKLTVDVNVDAVRDNARVTQDER